MYLDKKIKTIDKSAPIPMFYQLKQILLSDIKSNVYPPGNMIPTERELSEIYGISRTTVRQAVLDLVREGYLTRRKGKGTIVAEQKLTHIFVQTIESFNSEIIALGKTPSTEVVGLKRISATTHIADTLFLETGADVLYIHRKRMVDDVPIVTIITYLDFKRCEFLLKHNLEQESLYDLLSLNPANKIVKVDRRIEVTEAKEQDVKLLGIKQGKPIQLFYSLGKNIDDLPIEYSIARYRGDRSSFNVSVALKQD
ncbi:MAG: GntR family transcriptional regulator [Epulopiscium sp. Nuni2H_MBin003]|nr:MAG: GntR family transcriptional regulator [Epulopiscium sp. Nuni2H_MBin003]